MDERQPDQGPWCLGSNDFSEADRAVSGHWILEEKHRDKSEAKSLSSQHAKALGI